MKPNRFIPDDAVYRLFIAVPLPDEIKLILQTSIQQLRQSWPFQKWVHPQDMHITLKFLGETSASQVVDIESKLGLIAARFMPFAVSLSDLGIFGPPQAPSVLWTTVGGNTLALRRLQADVEQQVAELGFDPDARPYAPHVTLARRYVGETSRQSVQELLRQSSLQMSSAEWKADRLTLYRTHLGRTPMYEKLGDFVFYAGG